MTNPEIVGRIAPHASDMTTMVAVMDDISDRSFGSSLKPTTTALPKDFTQEVEQQELMKAGHEANARGDVKEALALFKRCFEQGERIEARISAANMLLKLGSQPRGDKYLAEAIAEYQTMLRQVTDSRLEDHVRNKLLALLLRKYKTSIDEAKQRRLKNQAVAEQTGGGGGTSGRKSLITGRKSDGGAGGTSGDKAVEYGLQVEHGTLTVLVMRALGVPSMDSSLFGKKNKRDAGSCDPYLVLELQGHKHKTRVGRSVAKAATGEDKGRSKRATVSVARAGEYVFPAERFEWRGELHELIVDDLGAISPESTRVLPLPASPYFPWWPLPASLTTSPDHTRARMLQPARPRAHACGAGRRDAKIMRSTRVLLRRARVLVVHVTAVRLKDKDTFAGLTLPSERIGEGNCDLLDMVTCNEMEKEVEMSAVDGKGTSQLVGAMQKCRVLIEVRWTPDQAQSEAGKLRVGAATGNAKRPVEVVHDGPLPGGMPGGNNFRRNGRVEESGMWPFGFCGFVCAQPRKPSSR